MRGYETHVKEAAERKREGQIRGGKTAGRGRPKGCVKSSDTTYSRNENRADYKAAQEAGVNRTTFWMGRKLRESRPDLWKKCLADEMKIYKAYKEMVRDEDRRIIEFLENEKRLAPGTQGKG